MHRQRGFGYLGILFAIAIGSVALAGLGTLWSLERQREKELELLFIGAEFQRAIGMYYQRSPGSVKRYPRSIEDLLKDNRFLGVQRYLRKNYVDPMTGKREWGLIQAPEGGIMGVHSLSGDTTLKRANFPLVHEGFEKARHYREWQFVYRPFLPTTYEATKSSD